MTVKGLLRRLSGVTKSGDGWKAHCPAHTDRKPSLSISEGRDGRILLHCHAGCSVEAICKAMDLEGADLFDGEPGRKARREIVASYAYHDEAGKPLFEVVRFEPKDFRQRRPNGKGGWTWNTSGARKVLFHLPQVIEAVKARRPVYVAEGEKDVLALEAAGFAATCNPGGAGKWRAEYGEHLAGAEVVIIADKDAAGGKHAQDVATKLHGAARSVRVIECPDVHGKPVKDASDYFAAGGQAADLDALAEAAPRWTPDAAKADPWMDLVEDGADMQARELPPVVEIIQGIVAERSKLSVVSSAKSFKTWLMIHAALAIAHGLLFLDRRTARRRVLYVNLELKPETFTRRLQAIAKALDIAVDAQWFSHLPLRGKLAGLTVHEVITRIIAVAQKLGVAVVVVDPLFKLNVEGEENSSRDQTVFCNELDRLTTEGRYTAIFNDHSGKGNQADKDPLDVIRGSSAKGGDLDAAMVLRKHEVEKCYSVDLVHRELPPVEPFVIGWKYPLMQLRQDLSPDKMKRARGGQARKYDPVKLCAAIADATAEKPVSISAWADAAGILRQTLQGYLPGLRAKGWLATTGEGSNARQYLTAKGREVTRHAKEVG